MKQKMFEYIIRILRIFIHSITADVNTLILVNPLYFKHVNIRSLIIRRNFWKKFATKYSPFINNVDQKSLFTGPRYLFLSRLKRLAKDDSIATTNFWKLAIGRCIVPKRNINTLEFRGDISNGVSLLTFFPITLDLEDLKVAWVITSHLQIVCSTFYRRTKATYGKYISIIVVT